MGAGARDPREGGRAVATSCARQQQAEIKASLQRRRRRRGNGGGSASPLKLYLGQILLAAANLSSAAHTNHRSASSRQQHQNHRGRTGGEGGVLPAGTDAC